MTSRLRKPARTPHAAVQRYTDYLQQSLACVSNSVWCFGPPVRAGEDQWVLFLPDDQPIPLNRRDNLGRVHLRALQRFRVIEDPEHEGEVEDYDPGVHLPGIRRVWTGGGRAPGRVALAPRSEGSASPPARSFPREQRGVGSLVRQASPAHRARRFRGGACVPYRGARGCDEARRLAGPHRRSTRGVPALAHLAAI
jgi:hypothetical protein